VRVLSPLFVLAAVALGCWLADKLSHFAIAKPVHRVIAALLVIATAWSALNIGQIPFSAPTSPPSRWLERSLAKRTPYGEFIELANDLAGAFPPGSRLVTNNSFLWSRLLDVNLAPVAGLSPEVDFMFDPRSSHDKIIRLARERHFSGVLIFPQDELDIDLWKDSPLVTEKNLLVPGEAPQRPLIILNFLPRGGPTTAP
jgi:hypothetical protein